MLSALVLPSIAPPMGFDPRGPQAEALLAELGATGARVTFLALGAPKQENWIHRNRDKLRVNLCMGLGGALDVFAGTVKRAPEFFIKCNLEWFYRFCKQPSRLNRFAALPRFMLTVKKER